MENTTNTKLIFEAVLAGIVFGKSEIGIDNLFVSKFEKQEKHNNQNSVGSWKRMWNETMKTA